MKKIKTGANRGKNDTLFPQVFPRGKISGETSNNSENGQNIKEPHLGHGMEPQQPTLDEIWEWLGNPNEY